MVRVLFPLDGSERSLAAMERACGMMKGMDVDATLFVVMSDGFSGDDREAMFDEDEDDEIFPNEDACQRLLDDAAARCKKQGIKVATKIGTGRTTKAILSEAEEYDMMVMHSLNKGGIGEKLRMSATEKLARKVACSVLLVQD